MTCSKTSQTISEQLKDQIASLNSVNDFDDFETLNNKKNKRGKSKIYSVIETYDTVEKALKAIEKLNIDDNKWVRKNRKYTAQGNIYKSIKNI